MEGVSPQTQAFHCFAAGLPFFRHRLFLGPVTHSDFERARRIKVYDAVTRTRRFIEGSLLQSRLISVERLVDYC